MLSICSTFLLICLFLRSVFGSRYFRVLQRGATHLRSLCLPYVSNPRVTWPRHLYLYHLPWSPRRSTRTQPYQLSSTWDVQFISFPTFLRSVYLDVCIWMLLKKHCWIFFLREREKETSICYSTYWCIHWLILVCALTGDWTHKLGVLGRCCNNLSCPARAKCFSCNQHGCVVNVFGPRLYFLCDLC